ncbi:MAG: NAD-dependent epimerase/dehydratase family protein [Verrucomicrobiae bacterium]|nr:NAD-dependent epimerase/dehydratase family protein [Verrucomicrobiae bacterium]
MKLLITGICGFVGCRLARNLSRDFEVVGVDNFCRAGSELNRRVLSDLGIRVRHADLRLASDLESLPQTDWVIEAAANPSVLAGVDGRTSSRQLTEQNLLTTLNTLEFCKKHGAGFIMLSTSRVYGIRPLSSISVKAQGSRFVVQTGDMPAGIGSQGIREDFSTSSPISLYGATKLASETMSLEYGDAFGFPVRINRCGVMAGAGQFGRADQGIFSFWIHSFREQKPLKYIGFGGKGYQVRDCLHPEDLAELIRKQMVTAGDLPSKSVGQQPATDNRQPIPPAAQRPTPNAQRIFNVSGGLQNSMSLAELSQWCGQRYCAVPISSDPTQRPFDLPWVVLDSSRVRDQFDWVPQWGMDRILEEIATFAESHSDWLELTAGS